MAKPNDNVVMESVQIIFRNFAGKEGQYNREGDRNFGVILPDEVVEPMSADGWNVKQLKVRDDDLAEDPEAQGAWWLPIKLGYSEKSKPPRVVLITSRGKTNIDETTIDQLDWVDIQNADLIIGPYDWNVQGNSGRSAYLRSLYITIEEDELERKYAELDAQ